MNSTQEKYNEVTHTNEAVRRVRRITTIVATVLSLAAVHGLAQEASTASITAATADFALQPPQLTITGTGFGSAKPVVDLDGLPLSLISFTSTRLVAQLSTNQASGSFLLQVKPASGSTVNFDATIGTTGPQGPQGLQGNPGTPGLPGPQAPQGVPGPGTNLVINQLLVAQAAGTVAQYQLGCNAGGTVIGGTCGSGDFAPASGSITMNGSGLSGDGTVWIRKTTNYDTANAHPMAYGSLCSYPVAAAGSRMAKPVPHAIVVPIPATK